ncbi:hypothetical protein MNB_SV-6-1007 [hydrothermal vent metagenome]|uniref:Uncharacterized protein n=1 Tax=hydrothermal vent metagenome TaxID=652676 RepID=A0A1W1C7D4_9ZZZZ
MKKFFLTIFIIALSVVSTTTILDADANKGQKIFKKNFRKACGFSGVKFARYHTQDEWKDIYKDGKFPEEVKRICPRLKKDGIGKSAWSNLYDFAYKYASDSSHIPSC